MASMKSPDINLIYFILRLLVAVGSLLSAIFKVPFIIIGVQFAIDFYIKSKKGQTDPSSGGGSAGGGASDGGGQSEPASDSPSAIDVPIIEASINIILLVCLFITVLVVLLRTVYTVALGRLINVYSYLIFIGLWIVFVLIAIMADGWQGLLNYAILAARTLLVGFFAVKAPSSWHFVLLRTSIIVDIVTYPAMIGIAILNLKYSFLKAGTDRKIGVWTRYNNLIRTL